MLNILKEKFKNVVQVADDEIHIQYPEGYEIDCYLMADNTIDLIISKEGEFVLTHIGLDDERVIDTITCLAY